MDYSNNASKISSYEKEKKYRMPITSIIPKNPSKNMIVRRFYSPGRNVTDI
jgi:hypothetical protein